MLLGCPGRLEDIERFATVPCGTPGQPACTTTSTRTSTGTNTSTIVTAADTLIRQRCATPGCHPADNPQAGLDLATADIAGRLSDVMSPTTVCRDRILLVPGDGQASLLYDKLLDQPVCGSPMPLVGDRFTEAERAEVRAWIDGLGR